MKYYSTKARESAVQNIHAMQVKIASIPGDTLSFSDAAEINRLLSTLEDYISSENKQHAGEYL